MQTRYNSNSIVDTLAKAGQPSDYASRATLAKNLGITNYQGTGAQNTDLIKRYTNNVPVTPTAPVAPTASKIATTPTPTAPKVSRYTNPLDTYKDYYSKLKTNFTSGDENAIREAERARVQEQLNSVEAMAGMQRGDQIVENKQASGRTRSILSASGLGGSGRGLAKTTETEKYNQKQLQSIENEKQAKIAALLAGVDDRASKAIEAARQEAKGNFEAKLKFDKESVDAAKNSAIDFAKLGVTQDKLDPKDIEDIMSQTGMSKLQLDALWNGNLPDSMKTQYQDVTTQGANGNATLTRVGHNPQTGEVTKQVYDLGVPYTDVAKGSVEKYGKDGLMIVYPNGTHKVLVGSSDNSTSSGGSYVPGADKVVDSWAERIQNGSAKITEIKDAGLRNKVTVALTDSGNNLDGKPTVTELGKAAKTTAQSLLDKFNAGKGTSAVGKSAFLGSMGLALIPGTDRSNFVTDFDSLKSQLALEGVKYLKGQGSVSDSERALLAQATSKLSLKQSEEEFKKTLTDIINKLNGVSPTDTTNSDQYATERAQIQQGEILVQDKNGNVGAIPEGEFDPSLYTKI